jgi:hypothetical protein
MPSSKRAAGLSKKMRGISRPGTNRGDNSANGSGGWTGTRVLLVLVLTPALIVFMSRKDVGHADTKARRAPHASGEWPLSGPFSRRAAYPPAYRRAPAAFARYDYLSDPGSADLVYARALFIAGRYDSRPYWTRRKLQAGAPTDRATADLAIEHLIPCESMGRSINRIDSNGRMSYGILQFQDWNEWEAVSGLRGDPDNRVDAIRMAEWAIENGMINHWGCAQILKMSDD